MLRRLFLFGLAASLMACATPQGVKLPRDMTLIIVRHADRDGEELSALGLARSEALVPALEGMHIDAIFSPSLSRNLDTAEPLAMARGLEIGRLPAGNPLPGLVNAGGGKTVVWVGNKGNLRSIWESLSAPGEPPLEYGDLFIVTRARFGAIKVDRRRFVPSELSQ